MGVSTIRGRETLIIIFNVIVYYASCACDVLVNVYVYVKTATLHRRVMRMLLIKRCSCRPYFSFSYFSTALILDILFTLNDSSRPPRPQLHYYHLLPSPRLPCSLPCFNNKPVNITQTHTYRYGSPLPPVVPNHPHYRYGQSPFPRGLCLHPFDGKTVLNCVTLHILWDK